VGINVPTVELTALLMGEEQELTVASIVGFGGLGKTTLANQVYRKLQGNFECRAFITVSQKPDILKLLNKLLIQIGGCVSPTSELDDLLKKITEQLQDKRY
jgi:disease resistance protein RPM1